MAQPAVMHRSKSTIDFWLPNDLETTPVNQAKLGTSPPKYSLSSGSVSAPPHISNSDTDEIISALAKQINELRAVRHLRYPSSPATIASKHFQIQSSGVIRNLSSPIMEENGPISDDNFLNSLGLYNASWIASAAAKVRIQVYGLRNIVSQLIENNNLETKDQPKLLMEPPHLYISPAQLRKTPCFSKSVKEDLADRFPELSWIDDQNKGERLDSEPPLLPVLSHLPEDEAETIRTSTIRLWAVNHGFELNHPWSVQDKVEEDRVAKCKATKDPSAESENRISPNLKNFYPALFKNAITLDQLSKNDLDALKRLKGILVEILEGVSSQASSNNRDLLIKDAFERDYGQNSNTNEKLNTFLEFMKSKV